MASIPKAMYFMGALDDGDMQWLATHGSRRFVPSGTVLIREGEPIESILILLDGQLSVTIRGGFLLATLMAGEILGEISFVDSRPPLATVTAVENSTVLRMSRDVLRRKLENDIPFSARFYRAAALYLADRLRVTSRRLGYGDPEQELDPDELDETFLDNVSMGATRFDVLLRMLSIPQTEVVGR
jgi:CRP/FNR family transcriptional regulator, cyclic AMP receptor protein